VDLPAVAGAIVLPILSPPKNKSRPLVRRHRPRTVAVMSIELNSPALRLARSLVRDGKVVHDERDDWSGAAPSAEQENAFIDENGWTEYSHWHLGIDKSENRETKRAYSFPFGDFDKVRRSGVISAESRAGQYDHTEIRDALKSLLDLIDEDGS